MLLVKTAAAVLNQTPLDWTGNEDHIRRAVAQARQAGASVLCLPELCITGYGCEDAFLSQDTCDRAWAVLQRLKPLTRDIVVSVGLPVRHRNVIFTVACLLVDGTIAGFVAKQFLAGDGIHYEPRWFKPWPSGVQEELNVHGETHPIGDLIFNIGGLRVGFEICEDAWAPNRPGGSLARRGVDMILNPSASHFAFHKLPVRERFVVEGSRAMAVSYVYSNLLGNEAGRALYDGGALIASNGALLACGTRFSYEEVGVTTAVVDVEKTRLQQARTTSFQPTVNGRREEGVVTAPFTWPEIKPESPSLTRAAWESSPRIKEEEFTRAVSLGLFDYLRKSRSQGFVVSLSGGADSAAVTVLCHLALEFALRELGDRSVRQRLSHLWSQPDDWCAALLLTVYQSTANSGDVTRRAARAVAKAAGSTHLEMDIDSLVSGYREVVEKSLNRALDWKTDDIALQNIQARARSPGIWMLANIRGALLLSTSNRSEAAVGYATMDGDTSGGLSPISGIDKAFLRRWLRWMEGEGPDGLKPWPALRAVNVQDPTAELRPADQAQTDEKDLMPYPVLDAIERAAVRDKQSPAEVLRLILSQYPEETDKNLRLWTARFFRLWCRNQWKRERYAPGFHLDDENLDPKTWCRFPILSGGYETELAELESSAD